MWIRPIVFRWKVGYGINKSLRLVALEVDRYDVGRRGIRNRLDVAEWSAMLVGIRLMLAAVLLVAVVPATGQATNDAAGHVTAFACTTLPFPLNIEVETSAGSPQADRLRPVLIRSLAARQVVVTSSAPLRLSLYVLSTRHLEIGNKRVLSQLDGGDAYEERIWIRVNIWSNKRNSVIGGRRYQSSAVVDELHVEITLDSRVNGQCIWQGKAVFRLDGRDEMATAEQLIPLLLDRLGRSARVEPIELD